MNTFKLKSDFTPKGDQPKAIDSLYEGVLAGKKHQVLLGVTGSGKTFTLANLIAKLNRPTLVMAPNKTLAAQLYEEFKEFFPENAVHYFVSYYDYYQPEAYVPSTDTYIEKDSQINEEIDRLRHAATHSLLTRKDVIIVASVSYIYGLGSPDTYQNLLVTIVSQTEMKRNQLLERLVNIQYTRGDVDFHRGTFRVRGDIVEIFPAYEEERAIRVEFFGDFIESITEVDPLRGLPLHKLKVVSIYPASHYVTALENRKRAIDSIRKELQQRLQELHQLHKELEAKRLEQRTFYDIEMIEELGYCQGIENYSRHMDGRNPGEPPPTLIDYFPEDFLMVLDESHVSVPQITGMYKGDRARKMNLVEYGFRLPSALDNRPLNFDEYTKITEKNASGIIYVSATPADYELQKSGGEIIEQIIRPTGLLDPMIYVRSAKNQVQDLLEEVKKRTQDEKSKTRTLVTVLTKKMAEDLTTYLQGQKIKVRYMHSDVETLERIEILRDLRLGIFDVLVGINLLREGLDLPEVSLVAIFDADKEGFLRSERSLIQTIGRAARNLEGTVMLYADTMTKSMERAISETNRRRKIQDEYNKMHNIAPQTIKKNIAERWDAEEEVSIKFSETAKIDELLEQFKNENIKNLSDIRKAMNSEQQKMLEAAKALRFEEAAHLRDRIKALKQLELTLLSTTN